jgi:hypothetical protein
MAYAIPWYNSFLLFRIPEGKHHACICHGAASAGPSPLPIDGIGSLSELLVGIGLSFPVVHFIRLSQGDVETASLIQASTGESNETPPHLSNRGNASGVR